jgi:hypothetical protein
MAHGSAVVAHSHDPEMPRDGASQRAAEPPSRQATCQETLAATR